MKPELAALARHRMAQAAAGPALKGGELVEVSPTGNWPRSRSSWLTRRPSLRTRRSQRRRRSSRAPARSDFSQCSFYGGKCAAPLD